MARPNRRRVMIYGLAAAPLIGAGLLTWALIGRRSPTPEELARRWTVIQYNVPGWNVVFLVNGIPLDTVLGQGGFLRVDGGYEKPGANTITIVAKQAGSFIDDLDLKIEKDNGSGNFFPIAAFHKTVSDAGEGGTWTVDYPGRPDAVWAFANIQTLSGITADDKSEILQQITDLSKAVTNHNADTEVQAYSFGVTAAVEGGDPTALIDSNRAMMSKGFASYPKTDVTDLSQLDFQAFPGGVIVTNSGDNRWIIRMSNPADLNADMDVTRFVFCKMGGKWVLVK